MSYSGAAVRLGLALMDLVVWRWSKNICKNLLHIVIGALKERSHMGAGLDEVTGEGLEDEKNQSYAQWKGSHTGQQVRGQEPRASAAEE